MLRSMIPQIHLIISKWLRKEKCRQKQKKMSRKHVEVKEEIAYESVFISRKCSLFDEPPPIH